MQQGAGMDIDALHSALVSLTLLPEEIRSVRESLLASAGNGVALAQFLSGMERDLRIAKASLARDLGSNLCQCCWPPELMTPGADGKLVCAARLEMNPSNPPPSILAFVPAAESSRNERNERWDSSPLLQKEKLLQLRDPGLNSTAGVTLQNRASSARDRDREHRFRQPPHLFPVATLPRRLWNVIDEAFQSIEEGA